MITQIKKEIVIISLSIASNISLMAQWGYVGADYLVGGLNLKEPDNNSNYLIQIKQSNSNYKGVTFRFTDYPDVNIGLGISSVSFKREIKGYFSKNNEYGFAIISNELNYWSLPISLSFQYRQKTGMCISYIPKIIGYTNQSIEKFGSAENSEYLDNFPEDYSIFQHSLIWSLNTEISSYRSSFLLSFNPYIGIGSGYLKAQKQVISSLSYVLKICIMIALPEINIYSVPKDNWKKKKKEEELKKKQEEINQKINNNNH